MTPKQKNIFKTKVIDHPVLFRLVMFAFLIVLALSVGMNIRVFLDEINRPNDAVFANIEALYNREDKRTGSTHDSTIEVNGIIWKKVGPTVATKVVIDSSCESCLDLSKEDILKDILPFSKITVVDVATQDVPEGVTAVPTIMMDKRVEEVEDFDKIKPYLRVKGEKYELSPQAIGMNTGTVIVDPELITSSEDGRLVIEEYSEFACPYCKRFATETEPRLKELYGDQIVIDFRHFIVHESAIPAALAAECTYQIAGEDAFWDMHELLFAEQDFSEASIQSYAQEVGVASGQFDACLESEETLAIIQADTAAGQAIGVTGTPSFLVKDTVVVGAQPLEAFKSIIDSKLANNE